MTENSEIPLDGELPQEAQSTLIQPPRRSVKVFKSSLWIALSLFFLLSFTLIKLPREQIQNYIFATISSSLSQQGYSITAEKTELSFFLGLSYSMRDVKLTTPIGSVLKIDKFTVSPAFLPVFTGKLGADLAIQTPGKGKIEGTFATNKKRFSSQFRINSVELKSSGILEALANISASGEINGSGELSGDYEKSSNSNGSIKLDLKKVVIDQQKIVLNIPKMNISEAKAEVQITNGKVQIRTFNIGKPGTTDDIQGTLGGELTLASAIENSSINLQTKFKLSENVHKTLVILDAFLSSGKQADGSYAFLITGTLSYPNYGPLPPT